MSLKNTHTKLTGHPMEIALSPDILGRTFNGIGQPIDDLGPLVSTLKRDVNGLPLNPVRREYPRNYIRTGISAIDGLTTLIRGQKLPIFSGNGLPHDQLAAQIVQQASLGGSGDEKFAIVFAGGFLFLLCTSFCCNRSSSIATQCKTSRTDSGSGHLFQE